MSRDEKKIWEDYTRDELAAVVPMLSELGFEIDEVQPHIEGERYLMQAVTTTSGRKLILLGKQKTDGKRVVIKTTSDTAGMQELEHERVCRKVLQEMRFAYQIFAAPEELLFVRKDSHLVSIQEFIEQESAFLARPLEEQFSYALKAFKAQESAHATTYEHTKLIAKTFGSMDAEGYRHTLKKFKNDLEEYHKDDTRLSELLERASSLLEEYVATIEQYTGFLTHTDFVPHNFRIKDGAIYLLDHSSLRFGNKYEGWARFLNFMTLYNPELEKVLVKYVKDNRTLEESLSLKLMRVYRLCEILAYYTVTLEKSSGSLRELNAARVSFWSQVLEATLNDVSIDEKVRTDYQQLRDSLRSEDEKKRQIGLH